MTRHEIERCIAASVITAFPSGTQASRERFRAELSDLKPSDFENAKYRNVFERFLAGTLAELATEKLIASCEPHCTHAGHVRWHALELLKMPKGVVTK